MRGSECFKCSNVHGWLFTADCLAVMTVVLLVCAAETVVMFVVDIAELPVVVFVVDIAVLPVVLKLLWICCAAVVEIVVVAAVVGFVAACCGYGCCNCCMKVCCGCWWNG